MKRALSPLIPAILLAMPLAMAAPVLAQDTGPNGYFVTLGDDTGEPHGLVELRTNAEGELEGFLRGSFDPTADMSDSCTTCPDELLGQPVMGLRIVYGLEPRSDTKFKSGRVVDPEGGKIYKAKVEYADDFGSVELRGYVGTPLLGRTQTWRRATGAELATIDANNGAFGLPPLMRMTN